MSLINIIVLLLIIIISLTLFIMISDSKLFTQTRDMTYTPELKYTEFNAEGLNGWYFNNYENENTILHMHGNNDNISARKYIIDLSNKYKFNLIVWDYTGYGKSKGSKPYQYSLIPDSEKIYSYITDVLKIDPKKLIIIGESLGTYMATHLASTKECLMLLIFGGYSSMTDILKDYDSSLWSLVGDVYSLLYDDMNTKEIIKSVNKPILLVHSTEDELIDIKSAERLHDIITHDCKILIKVKGEHAEPIINQKVMTKIMEFMKNYKYGSFICPNDILDDIVLDDIVLDDTDNLDISGKKLF